MSQGTRKLKMWGSAPSQSLGALFGCRLSALSAGRRRRQQIRPDDLYPIPAAIGTIPLTAAAAPIAPRSESFQVTPRQPELTFARVVNAQKKNKLRLRGTEMLAGLGRGFPAVTFFWTTPLPIPVERGLGGQFFLDQSNDNFKWVL